METVDVSDLPEPFAQAVKALAETYRRELAAKGRVTPHATRAPVELPVWPLGVIGKLTREEIYDDRV